MAHGERFMVVGFTEQQGVQRPFDAWPQHMTILPWMQGYRIHTTNRIRQAVAGFGNLKVAINGEEQFGPNNDIRVWTLEKNDILQGLHEAVLGAATKYGTELEDMTYVGDAYSPHITQKAGQPEYAIGDEIIIPEISIIGKHDIGRIAFTNIRLGA